MIAICDQDNCHNLHMKYKILHPIVVLSCTIRKVIISMLKDRLSVGLSCEWRFRIFTSASAEVSFPWLAILNCNIGFYQIVMVLPWWWYLIMASSIRNFFAWFVTFLLGIQSNSIFSLPLSKPAYWCCSNIPIFSIYKYQSWRHKSCNFLNFSILF